jgi:hypothetical protein
LTQTSVQGFLSFRIFRLWKRLYIPFLTWTLSFLFLGATGVVFVAGLQSMQFQLFEKKWGWLLDTLWAVAAANDLIIAATLVFWLARKREDSELMFVASVVRSMCFDSRSSRRTPVVDKVIAWTIGAFRSFVRLTPYGLILLLSETGLITRCPILLI